MIFKNKSLKTQFIIYFVSILILSILATIVTYYIGYLAFINIQYKKVYPANYYEKMIPSIESKIRGYGPDILNIYNKSKIDKIIPKEGIKYQVMNQNGDKIYGTDSQKLIRNRDELYKIINTTSGLKGSYYKIIPIINKQGMIEGAVSLSYTLTPYFINKVDKYLYEPLFIIIVISPFIYIALFTILFSLEFTKNIRKPLNLIIEASRKIKERDLNFDIDYKADNELGSLCVAFNDMKDELKNSLTAQWKIEQERHEMVESLAHDLKTPISIIKGYAESLLDDCIDDKLKFKKYLDVILENTDKCIKIVKMMLFMSELDDSPVNLNFSQINIKDFLTRKIDEYKQISKDKSLNFDLDILDKRHDKAMVYIDVQKFERVMDNIVINSIRYTPELGMIKIRCNVDEDKIYITVCDSGSGFNQKDLTHVFERFYRGDVSRSSEDGHVGLGLYIAKKLVEIHGGEIEAYNREGGGACIKFDLKYEKSV
ncbi:HAMP domain-containing sensor histidine kinase [Thermoanaerobacterium thermosaccharolyticum]|uniref:HAMP domain-containing sensor histidine kinase n=1 Tax=Thermoanaerobacterium thermosaccharolyticum TaxID=1517 RepID=UPI003D2810AA